MLATTRRWFRRNRTTLAVSAACIGATYLAGQYVVGKITEARQRMSEERVGKENLRRRFEQNQEDCTYTVLALLPTIREEIIGALPVEQITEQLQEERKERLRRAGVEGVTSEVGLSSAPGSVTDDAGSASASALGGSYLHASQTGSEGSARPRRSKAQLWQEMKIHSIARALTLLYTVSLLTLLTRIQLNLLGRRTYLSSVVALAAPPAAAEEGSSISLENRDDDNYDNFYGNDFDTNRKYLTFSWWLLHRGSKDIMERVMEVVKEVFGGVNIREDIEMERLRALIMQCRMKIEGETEQDRRQMKWLQYLLPPRDQESFVIRQAGMSETSEDSPSPEARNQDDPMAEAEAVSPSLRRLLDETSDLIDSPTFTHVLTRLLDASFSHLVDYRIAMESFKAPAPGTAQPRVEEVGDDESGPRKCKLAHILPVFCRQAHSIAAGSGEIDGEGGFGNEYLQAMDQVQDLRGFAAVIYSSNFEYEVAESSAGQRVEDFGASVPEIPLMRDEDAPESARAEVADGALGESEVVVPEKVVVEEAPAQANEPPQFEAAWKKALAEEDGRQKGNGDG